MVCKINHLAYWGTSLLFRILINHCTSITMTERLFFALWPNKTIREAINALTQPITQDINGKRISPDLWHITLVFLGEVELSTKRCMQEVADRIQLHPFNLSLDTIGYWPRPRVLWLGATQTPVGLRNLVTHLSTDLQNCGYRPEKRPFQTHLTLMRKANPLKTVPTITPITWTVEEFCLVRSTLERHGAHYEVIKRWPLHPLLNPE
jgi:RNA 2',3'-cyclic 3'-phosphodiesterase